jgi:protein-S-isoprenylcysteine O-methyltransferase Ste14
MRMVAGSKGKFSDLILNFGGGTLYFLGSLTSVLDFIIIQHATYHFDFVSLLGFVFIIVGLGVRLQATRTLGKYFSPKTRVLPEHKLIKSGIYKHIRHPIYLGSMLAFFSITLIFHSLYGFIVTALAIPFILNRIRVEEQMFTQKFGDEYREYIKKSKKLIPFVY